MTGEGGRYDELISLANELGMRDQVVFWGLASRVEVVRLLHGCDLLVMPSRSEGLPLSILEAYACRKPVVASRVGGIIEIVDVGRTGLLVEPEDVDALADAIASLLGDPEMRAQMSQTGRQIAEENDWDRIVDHYLEVFEAVITNSGITKGV